MSSNWNKILIMTKFWVDEENDSKIIKFFYNIGMKGTLIWVNNLADIFNLAYVLP